MALVLIKPLAIDFPKFPVPMIAIFIFMPAKAGILLMPVQAVIFFNSTLTKNNWL